MRQDYFPKFEKPSSNKNPVLQVVFDADLRSGHLGLQKIAQKLDIPHKNLHPGEFIVFFNRKRSALKLFAAGNIIAHFKTPNEGRMDLRTIGLIPRYFNGTSLNYEAALKEVLTKGGK